MRLSKSTTAKASPEIIRLIKATEPQRELAIYWAELREWSELPFYKRLFKPAPKSKSNRKD